MVPTTSNRPSCDEKLPVTFGALSNRFTKPPGKLYLLYGDPSVFRMSLAIASQALACNMPVAVVDGCNRFDPHAIAQFARRRHIDPDALLNRIFVSRGFTCYQMEAAITNRLSPMLQRINSHAAFIFGLLDTFYDEQAPLREVRHMLDRIVTVLHSMRSQGTSILLTSQEWNVRPEERNQLFATLKMSVDHVYRLEHDASIKPQLFFEQQRSLDHGTNRTDVHEYHRERAGKLVEVSPRPAERGPGNV
jgi:hypothetical protein